MGLSYKMARFTIALSVLVLSLTAAALAVPTDKNFISCTICTGMVGLVEDLLLANETLVAIEEAVDRFCDLLPNDPAVEEIVQGCHDFAFVQLPYIIETLLNTVYSPTEICTNLLNACP